MDHAEDGSGGDRVYVGESDNVGVRTKKHDLSKLFWDDSVVITKTDGSLYKADVRHLEARLVKLARQSPLVGFEVHHSSLTGPLLVHHWQ